MGQTRHCTHGPLDTQEPEKKCNSRIPVAPPVKTGPVNDTLRTKHISFVGLQSEAGIQASCTENLLGRVHILLSSACKQNDDDQNGSAHIDEYKA